LIDASRRTSLIVGAFVLVLVALLAGVLFFLGAATRVLTERAHVTAEFPTAGGLRQGASVLLAGVNVGTVAEVRLAPKGEPGARVVLALSSEAYHRLHADAVAVLQTVGLLGDRVIALEPGQSPDPLPKGATLPGRVPLELGDVVTKVGDAVDALTALTRRVDAAVAGVDTHRIVGNVEKATDGLRRIVTRVERGPGLLHDLAYDHALADEIRAATVDLHSATTQLAAAGAGSSELVRHLDSAARRVDQIVANVQAGRGTLGGLIYDPAIYENLRAIVANVRRSLILRALVRFAIRHMDRE
jgi:phospholipid/cholesterol/gamma-HCH transport system substrate-binding protein